VSWTRKVCSGEGVICFNQGGMFHGYHDARRPLLHPCNNKGKTLASSGYKSQRMYCTGGRKKETTKKTKGEKQKQRGERQQKNTEKKGRVTVNRPESASQAAATNMSTKSLQRGKNIVDRGNIRNKEKKQAEKRKSDCSNTTAKSVTGITFNSSI